MKILRRFLLIAALMFWQGGFMFYGAVVVPIVRAKFVGKEPGEITRDVTIWMHVAGAVAVFVMFADVWASGPTERRRRWLTWLGMVLLLPVLLLLHAEMSRQMMDPTFFETGIAPFRQWHIAYMLCITAQWFAGMAFVLFSLRAWRAEDAVGIR